MEGKALSIEAIFVLVGMLCASGGLGLFGLLLDKDSLVNTSIVINTILALILGLLSPF